MLGKIKNFVPILLLTLIPTLLLWAPFFLHAETIWTIPLPPDGMATVVANYDGPLYIAVAKTFYNLEQLKSDFSFNLPVEYFAAHFPLFPLLIRLFSFITYSYSMLVVTVASSILAILFFNKLIKKYVKSQEDALFLTFAFAIFPARWLITRSVGSPEPLFLASIIASIFYFTGKKYWAATFWAIIASLTKSPGALLFVAYVAHFIFEQFTRLASIKTSEMLKKINFKIYPIILIPLATLAVFLLFKYKFDDFLAYFHSGDNIHLFFPPFQIFNYSAPWVGTFWLEDVIFIYLIGALGVVTLFQKKHYEIAIFSAIFFATTIFISHRDLSRYFLPIVPFLYVAFADFLSKKEFKIAFLFIVIPIFLYSLSFISQNAMPISNWQPFIH